MAWRESIGHSDLYNVPSSDDVLKSIDSGIARGQRTYRV